MKLSTSFPSRGSYLWVHFCHSCDVLMLVLCLVRMWISAVDEGPCSTSSGRRYNIYDQTWDLSTPSLVRSLSYDPCLRITNLLSIFEQRAKLSSDSLRSLLPFHCSSPLSACSSHFSSCNWDWDTNRKLITLAHTIHGSPPAAETPAGNGSF